MTKRRRPRSVLKDKRPFMDGVDEAKEEMGNDVGSQPFRRKGEVKESKERGEGE